MRSRYAAYAKGLVDYLMDTTHPDSPHHGADREQWAKELDNFCRLTRFEGLTILDAPPHEGDAGTVTFRAGLSHEGRDTSFTERSTFLRVDGRWLYVDGTPT